MSTMVNASRVFDDSPKKNDFLAAITVASKVEDDLRAARDEMRETIRLAFGDYLRWVKREELFAATQQTTSTALLKPKFRMQGSFAYRTLNDPSHRPPQEVDLDDGMFLPVSFLVGNGGTHPAILSRGLFQLVERALQPLCERRKWILDTSRPSCIRIRVSGAAHIDLALYSVPDQQFVQLSESVLARRAKSGMPPSAAQLLELDEEVYRGIASEQIMLAHREEGWKPSDPRKLEEWFQLAIQRHGYMLRRICRYLKAWRDFQWRACKLSSIALMACAVKTFDVLGRAIAKDRDDLALEHVARELREQLRESIENPVVKGQYLDENWSDQMRADYCARALVLYDAISAALHRSTTAAQVLGQFESAFGPRVPDDQSLVRIEEERVARSAEISGAPAVLTSGLLRDRGQSPEAQQAVQKAGERRYA